MYNLNERARALVEHLCGHKRMDDIAEQDVYDHVERNALKQDWQRQLVAKTTLLAEAVCRDSEKGAKGE